MTLLHICWAAYVRADLLSSAARLPRQQSEDAVVAMDVDDDDDDDDVS